MALESTFVSPFAVGTIEILKIQCGIPFSVGPSRNMDSSEPVEGDIRGVISVQADTFKGFMLVGFPEPTYVAILSKMFGEKYTKISPELRDGAGEFANMIFGYAKRVLTEQGKKVEMARPEVLLGTTGPSGSSASRVSIEFKSEIGPVFLELRELV